MADGRSSASIVVVDAEELARERDAAVRALIADSPLDTLQQYNASGLELTVPYTLSVVAASSGFERAKTTADEVLRSAWLLADTVLNNYNPDSEVSLINRLPVKQKHQMSAPLKRVIACCQRVCNSSSGAFDPAVGPLLDAIREAVTTDKIIPAEKFEALSRVATLQKSFEIDLDKGTIARKHEHARLDLGGVSKGYTVDYVIEKLNAAGFENCYFNWGGDCRGSGVNTRNSPWMVGIIRPPTLEELTNPLEKPPFIHVVQLTNEALATSGDYENLVKGPKNKLFSTTYDSLAHWLIQPSQNEIAQVSVKCYSAMYADALATAALAKRDTAKVRYMLDGWRYVRDTVTDYIAYIRENERVARMYEIATENAEMHKKRIAGALPARVIVVGGGLAGQSAAIEAANCGAQVVLIEKENKLGGNSAKATSGINGWGTRAQAKQNIPDSGKYFERDTFKSGIGGDCDAGLVKTLSVKSADAIRFLTNLGIPLTVLSQLGGHSQKRTHRAPDMADGTPVPIGFTIMKTLETHIRTNMADRVTIMEGTSVSALLHETDIRPDGIKRVRVTGVEIIKKDENEKMRLLADAVVLATGGFSNDKTDKSLLKEYAPQLMVFPTTNGPWATGDGVKLARELGATLVDMDKVQLHPTGLIDPKDPANGTKYLGPEALRGSGGILLNKKGERFVNELDLRSVVSKAIIDQRNEYPGSNGSSFAYCVLNDEARKLFGVNSHGFYWKKLGLFVKADTLEDLAKLIECSPGTLRQTLEEYESLSKDKRSCPKTNKTVYPCVIGPQGPFYVAFVTPSIHYTMGGCLISPSGELQSQESHSAFGHRRPIQALFGAGEVTGGVHGRNRLGGNSLLECVVFGRIAGSRAAQVIFTNASVLQYDSWSRLVLQSVNEDTAGLVWLVFSLPSVLRVSGLQTLQTVVIRPTTGEGPVEVHMPFTSAEEEGVVGIVIPSIHEKDGKASWMHSLKPGDEVEMKAGPQTNLQQAALLKASRQVVIATPRGVGPMMQLIAQLFEHNRKDLDKKIKIHLIFLADRAMDIPLHKKLVQLESESMGHFHCTFVLRHPPDQWTGGLDYVDEIASSVYPDTAQGIFLFGSHEKTEPIKALLLEMGHVDTSISTLS